MLFSSISQPNIFLLPDRDVSAGGGEGMRPNASTRHDPFLTLVEGYRARKNASIVIHTEAELEIAGINDMARLMEENAPSPAFQAYATFYRGQIPQQDKGIQPFLYRKEQGELVIAVRGPNLSAEKMPPLASFLKDSVEQRLLNDSKLRQEGARRVSFVVVSGALFDAIPTFYEKEKREFQLEIRDRNQSAVEKLYDAIRRGIDMGASDIHIEPQKGGGSLVRFRIDGFLVPWKFEIPQALVQNATAVVKVLAGLDLVEKRRPQDGKIVFVGQKEVEVDLNSDAGRQGREKYRIQIPKEFESINLRVSTVPVEVGGHHTEKVVLRILRAPRIEDFKLETLGFSKRHVELITEQLDAPQGLLLVTGPTGSGKTTSLYSMLAYLNRSDTNIMTVEDPVEMQFPRINQVNVDASLGNTFAHVLRSFLRQDPDVIFLGEIRDPETASVAIQAANTGHLVLSTLHTNNSVLTYQRLRDLGVDRSQVEDTLRMVMSQRLVRVLNQNNAERYDGRRELTDLLGVDPGHEVVLKRPRSNLLPTQEYSKRTVVPELWIPGEETYALIETHDQISSRDLQRVAISEGLEPLVVSAMRLVLSGTTSLDEIRRTIAGRSDFRQNRDLLLKLLQN